MYNIVVLSRSWVEYRAWASRHVVLAEIKDRFRLIALIEEPSSNAEVSGLRADILISGKDAIGRIMALPSVVDPEDLILIAASDDKILSIGFPADNYDKGAVSGFQPKCYFDAEMKPALSNIATYDNLVDDPGGRIRQYFSYPLPGDNSLYYGLFKFKPWYESFLWSIEQIGGIEKINSFHAFDWLWMSRLVYSGLIARPSDHFQIQRFKTPWKHYHSETDYENNDFVEGNPIWPLIRVLLRAYPDVGLREPLFKWFEHKTQERLILTGGKKPDDLLIQYNNALRSYGL